MKIERDDLTGDEIASFLEAHVEEMRSITPPESKHALDLDGLRDSAITFWTGRDATGVVACGAIKIIGPDHGEIKSMRVAPERRGEGFGTAILEHIMASAASMGLRRLSLETGSSKHFLPARKLYERFGFDYCEPFGDYRADPNSVFMTRVIAPGSRTASAGIERPEHRAHVRRTRTGSCR